MRTILVAFSAAALVATAAHAALPVGAKAPDFKTMGALDGKPFRLHLAEQLRSGPVVLYFYPKAFTQGCTLEAKAFADAMPEFRKAGARVIGMSADNLDTLKKFSVESCRSQFPVATASASSARISIRSMRISGRSSFPPTSWRNAAPASARSNSTANSTTRAMS